MGRCFFSEQLSQPPQFGSGNSSPKYEHRAAPARAALGKLRHHVELPLGRRAFVRNGCHGCHTIGALGTPIASDLSHVGARYRAAYLTRWLRDPSDVRPSTHMPALELTEADVEALAAFLAAQQ